jgi:Tfp pilus assembly protein PilV
MTKACKQAPARRFLLREHGFTLAETMMAVTLLLVGILGIVAMADGASRSTASARARDNGVNTARRLIEAANSLAYTDVTTSDIVGKLQAKPGLGDDSAANGWQIVSRNVTYTVVVSLCDVDDPKDGTGTHTSGHCPGAGPDGSTDATPQDYKRVSAAVSWSLGPGSGTVTQATFVTPRGTADLPVITSLTSTVDSPVTDAGTTTVPFDAVTSSVPAGVTWLKDGNTMGLATGGGNAWEFDWNVSNLLDGDYVIGARPYDGSGSYGAPYYMTFTLNRYAPLAPTSFVAGYNSGDVSTEWLPNKERDIIGYTVKRQQTSPSVGPVTNVNCGTVGTPVYVTTKTTCKDASPISGLPSIDFVNSTKGTQSGSTLALAKPSGIQTSDVLIATVSIVNGNSITAPSGWTAIQNVASSGNDSSVLRMAMYYRVVPSGSEPASYSWGLGSTSRPASGSITAWRGVSTSSPVDVSASYDGNGTSSFSYTPAITTTGTNRLVLLAHGNRSSGTGLTLSTPSDTTRRDGETSTGVIHGQFSKLQASAGSTGTTDVGGACGYPCVTSIATVSPGGGHWVGFAAALRPSSTPIAVNYWVVAVDRDPAGANREGPASNVVNAYEVNSRPTAPSDPTLTVQGDGSRTLNWATAGSDPDAGDSVAFYRVYRDGVAYDRTSTGTELTYTDPNRDGGSHTYYLVAVDTHLRESIATASVSG